MNLKSVIFANNSDQMEYTITIIIIIITQRMHYLHYIYGRK
jgi:hypothetical protein